MIDICPINHNPVVIVSITILSPANLKVILMKDHLPELLTIYISAQTPVENFQGFFPPIYNGRNLHLYNYLITWNHPAVLLSSFTSSLLFKLFYIEQICKIIFLTKPVYILALRPCIIKGLSIMNGATWQGLNVTWLVRITNHKYHVVVAAWRKLNLKRFLHNPQLTDPKTRAVNNAIYNSSCCFLYFSNLIGVSTDLKTMSTAPAQPMQGQFKS